MTTDYAPGDVVRLRKPHPCGGNEWDIVSCGEGVEIRCRTCGHTVTISPTMLARRVKCVVYRTAPET